jgi:hypothetical protein
VGSYSGPNASQVITPDASITELATFAALAPAPPPATYTIEFLLAQSVAPGTAWSVTIGGSTYGSVGTSLNVTGLLAGTLTANVLTTYSPDALTEYTAENRSATIHVGPSTSPVFVTFKPAYWVEVTAVGPGSVSVGSEFVAGGKALSILATADLGDVLTSWTGTGPGAYSGSQPYANVTAVSGPLVEVATFASASQATTASSAPFLGSYAGLVLLAAVGLVAGALIGVMARKLGRRPPPARAGDPPAEPVQTWDESSEGAT